MALLLLNLVSYAHARESSPGNVHFAYFTSEEAL